MSGWNLITALHFFPSLATEWFGTVHSGNKIPSPPSVHAIRTQVLCFCNANINNRIIDMPEKKQKHAQTIPHSMMFANVW